MSVQIKPSDIDSTKHFFDTFGHNETEVSARLIVKFLQERGDTWESFTQKELDTRFEEDFWFNKLTNPKGEQAYLEFDGDNIRVTDRFIKKVFGFAGKLA